MGVAFASERRLLSADEYAPIAESHYPAIAELPHERLVELAQWLRQRRGRARDIVHDLRRVRRGKTAARGTAGEAASERGIAAKKQVFARALRRVNARLDRLRPKKPTGAVIGLREALRRKRAARVHHPAAGPTSHDGMQPIDSSKGTVATDPREIGRVSQFVRDAQARRDSRG